MAERIGKTQEEEILEMLEREGFRELGKEEIEMEPYKTIFKLPVCFKEDANQRTERR